MKFIELPSKDGSFLVNTDHILLVEPFYFKGEESVMVTFAHPIDCGGTIKKNVNLTYTDFKKMLK